MRVPRAGERGTDGAGTGGLWSISRSRHQRKAVRVLPVPVGARIRALSPRAMTGQPSRCGAVGASNTARNHSAVTGWKQDKGSLPAAVSVAGDGVGGIMPAPEDSAGGRRRGSEEKSG